MRTHPMKSTLRTLLHAFTVIGAGATGLACGSQEDVAGSARDAGALHALVGPAGGELVGAAGTPLADVHVVIPAGALAEDVDIEVRPATGGAELPTTAVRCGPQFELAPAGLALAVPASVTLPFDEDVVEAHDRLDEDVKVWVRDGDRWGQEKQIESAGGSVTIELSTLTTVAAGVNPPAPEDIARFTLKPVQKLLPCFAKYPEDPARAPTVDVTVVRGELNDVLRLKGRNFKPGLKFDLFTVEHSLLGADGKVDPDFAGFGLAWYQTDLEAQKSGSMGVTLRTILLDQIFGFDPAVGLAPTQTFHVGFWFNNPADAAACGFDATKPTPFNGEHEAGPLAMITTPDASTDLGPLCTKPDTSVSPARCDP